MSRILPILQHSIGLGCRDGPTIIASLVGPDRVRSLAIRIGYCLGAQGVLAFVRSGHCTSEALARPATQAVAMERLYEPNEEDAG